MKDLIRKYSGVKTDEFLEMVDTQNVLTSNKTHDIITMNAKEDDVMTDASWNKEKIVKLLETNDLAVARALVKLNQNQTFDEQEHLDVKYKNNKGFRPCHARMGSSMAKFFTQKGFLSQKQIAYWRARDKTGAMRIGIYAGQLLKEINAS